MDFAIPAEHRVKNKRKQKDWQILGSCQRAEQPVEHEGDRDINCSWYAGNSPQRFGKMTGGIKNQKNQEHTDRITAKISYNTQESPPDLKRLTVTQTPVKDHQLVEPKNKQQLFLNTGPLMV